jgi:gliding motility-associated-like protein
MDICFNSSNESYVTGYFTNSCTFHPFSLTSISAGIPDGFIYKTNPSGQILWAKRFGGTGSDRGISCKLDSNGDLLICGYYFGTITFGSITLTSSSGSQDVFVAKLDPNGNFIWAVSMGGNLKDIPNAMCVDLNDNVLITGSFHGVASFGASTFTSATNPQISLPSYDVFTSKLSSSGSFLWTRTGTAKFDDRGLNIASDSQGDVYVCGQFSDTIKFSNVHNNQIMNAVFLIKYSSAGNEVWLRKCAGTSAIAYGIAIDQNDNAYMAGDFTGNMVFYGSPNTSLGGNFQNKIYVSKFNSNGTLVWAKSDASKNYISARDITLDNLGNVYLFGEFMCGLTDYQNALGQGVFNSVGYRDLFASKYDATNGSRIWERQIGGPSDDQAHGIVLGQNNLPLFAASYMNKMSWPSGNFYTLNPPLAVYNTFLGGQAPQFCTDLQYNSFVTAYSYGFSDAIAGSLVDLSRQTYDYYMRSGSICSRPFVKNCIDNPNLLPSCPDTIKICPGQYVYTTPFTGAEGYIGPYHHFKWNTGDTIQNFQPTVTGPYHVTVTTLDGCFSSRDTSYVIVNPVPAVPKITDSKGFNFQQLPQTNKIIFCSLDSVKITGSWIFNNSFLWTGPYIYSAPDSSIWVKQKVGQQKYVLTVTNQFSCSASNTVIVKIDTLFNIIPKIKLNDTVSFCCGQGAFLNVYDSITNPNATNACIKLFDTLSWLVQPNTANVGPLNNCQWPEDGYFSTCTSGNYTVTAKIKVSNSCGTQTYVTSKSFYAQVYPNPTISLAYTGSLNICPGDSTMIVVSHSHPFQWAIGGSINSSNFTSDTVWIKHPGYYYISSGVTNTLTGCSAGANVQFQITTKPNPYLTLYPFIICPNDSVKLTCNVTNGINYAWVGPQGPITASTSSIWVKIPGYYHVVVTDADGCILTSNTVEVKQYNTPFLLPLPSNYLCPNDSTVIKVITNDTTLIQWLAPLSGGGTVKTVTAAGVYSCQVTMCNITTICTLQINQANPIASITASNFTFCPGDSIVLSANSNSVASWQWLPTNQTSSVIAAFETGNYTMTTTDPWGCTATTTISVSMNNNTPPPTATSNTVVICYGSSTVVSAASSGTVHWFTSPTGGNSFHTGTLYPTPTLSNSVTYYVANFDTSFQCPSVRVPITVSVVPWSLPTSASVNSITLCYGDSLKFFTPAVSNATYNWVGPNSFSSNLQNPVITPANASNSGTYYLWLSGNNSCTSNTIALNVTVIQLSSPTIVATTTVCEGDTIYLSAFSNYSNTSFAWMGPNNFSSSSPNVTIAPAQLINSGPYMITNSLNACSSEPNSIVVTVYAIPQTTPFVATNYCAGDTAAFITNSIANVTYTWNGPNNFTSYQSSFIIAPLTPASAGVYTFVASNNGCYSSISTVSLNVFLQPTVSLGPDTTYCFNAPTVTLTIDSTFAAVQWQNNSAFNFYNTNNISGLYWVNVTDSNGCHAIDSVNIVFLDCNESAIPPPETEFMIPEVFTPNDDGKNDRFVIKGLYNTKVKLTVFNRWGNLVYEKPEYDNSWNGSSNSKGYSENNKLPSGTYFYLVEFPDNPKDVRKGFVVLQY